MGFLLLGVDSLIACIAVAPIISWRRVLPFAALFGVSDGAGFLLGSAFGWSVPASTVKILQTAVLVALGCYWVALAAFFTSRGPALSGRGLAWILPWVLSIDNITYGLVGGHSTNALLGQAGEQALSSALLAGLGLAVGLALARAVPAMRRRAAVTSGVAGAALIVASGVLLVAG